MRCTWLLIAGLLSESALADGGSDLVLGVGFVRPGFQVSVRLSEADRWLAGGRRFLRVGSAILPHSGWVLFDDAGLDSLAGVEQNGHTLTRGPEVASEHFARQHLWWGAWATDEPGTDCATEVYLDADGSVKASTALTSCEIVDASPLEGFTSIHSDSRDDSLFVEWKAIPEADSYGVIIWEREPRLENFLEGIAAVSPALTRRTLSYATSWPHDDYTIGVWAANGDGSGEGVIKDYYALGLVGSKRPTGVERAPWACIKYSSCR